ncbi:MAG: PAS domain-containing protein [Rubrivivax sp.]|nr:PAS domain-containing protein [Rubrivivax sp.]
MNPKNASLRDELEARLRFERLIADLSSKFVNLPSGELDRDIEDAQRRICELLDIDRSTLWQLPEDERDTLVLTHVHRRQAGAPIPDRPFARDLFPWTTQRAMSGEILAISKLADLPPEAARDRESHLLYDTKSSLVFPLSVGRGPVFGLLTFAVTQEERSWPEELVNRLQVIAQIFANAIARKRSDEELRESRERLDLAADSAGVGLWSLDLESGMFWLTKTNRELLGLSPDEVVTLDRFLSVVHPADRDLIRERIRAVARSGEEDRVDYRVVLPDGNVRWVSSRGRARRSASGEPECLTGVTVDITDRKEAEEVARELTGRLINAHEEERARLARELHDDVTQRLARLAIDAGRVESLFSAASVSETLREVREGLVRLSEDVHTLSYRLHPSVLEDLGLAEALKTEIERVARQESIVVTAKLAEIPEPVPREVALCVFRVAQEALRNVARHAKARTADISVRVLDGGLELAVRDDGAGFEPLLDGNRRSLGLTSMRERVHLLHGELDIESAPGRGTTVVAWVPLKGGPS